MQSAPHVCMAGIHLQGWAVPEQPEATVFGNVLVWLAGRPETWLQRCTVSGVRECCRWACALAMIEAGTVMCFYHEFFTILP